MSEQLEIDELEECIRAKSNVPFYPAVDASLNNPCNKKDKNAIFRALGLDDDLDYEGNLKLHEKLKT